MRKNFAKQPADGLLHSEGAVRERLEEKSQPVGVLQMNSALRRPTYYHETGAQVVAVAVLRLGGLGRARVAYYTNVYR